MRLRPSMRENFRYILVQIVPTGTCEPRDLYRAVAESVRSLYGDGLTAQMWPSVMQVSGPYAIVRCRRGLEKHLETALSAISHIQDIPAAVHPISTSGTILSLKKQIPVKPTAYNGKATISGVTHDVIISSGGRIDRKEKGIYHEIPQYITEEDTEDINHDE